jgi:murein DD-endopeptidase MepM/ murein hydrolase activator NlpD
MNIENIVSSVPQNRQTLEQPTKSSLKSATEDFEGMFISYLLKVMRSTVDSESSDGELSMGKDIYTDMFDNEIALNIARTRGLGIGDMMYRQLLENGATETHLDQRIESPQRAPVEESASALPPATDAPLQRSSPPPPALSIPVQGRVTSGYGLRTNPITGNSEFHEGVDIAAPAGTAINAASSGTVIFSGTLGGFGNTVVLEHADGGRTLYAHASQLLVRPGEAVQAGQTIGRVGTTGRSTGPHLHFETLVSGQSVDPRSLVGPELSGNVNGPGQR